MEKTFEKLNLDESLIKGLEAQSITSPLPIQEVAIPPILEGKDVVAQAHTGSGKTLAFLLPLFQKIDISKKEVQALILAPTHELAMQIIEQVRLLAKNSEMEVSSAAILGNMNIDRQIKSLKTKPHIIVGSSGRILDLISKKKFPAHTLKSIVIDEADNLLDKNQAKDIQAIIKHAKKDTQIMLFSATINPNTIKVASNFLKNPELLNTCRESMLNPHIDHSYIICEQRKKFETLRRKLNKINPERAMVFVNNTNEVEVVVKKLLHHNKNAAGIFGKQKKQDRQTALSRFRSGKVNVLVSSDIAARGLDIPEITHVFSLDLPPSVDDYLHRAGRSARAHNDGKAICIISPKEKKTINQYSKELDIKIEEIK